MNTVQPAEAGYEQPRSWTTFLIASSIHKGHGLTELSRSKKKKKRLYNQMRQDMSRHVLGLSHLFQCTQRPWPDSVELFSRVPRPHPAFRCLQYTQRPSPDSVERVSRSKHAMFSSEARFIIAKKNPTTTKKNKTWLGLSSVKVFVLLQYAQTERKSWFILSHESH